MITVGFVCRCAAAFYVITGRLYDARIIVSDYNWISLQMCSRV